MNRSIFQIWQPSVPKKNNIFSTILTSIFIGVLIIFENKYNCFSVKGVSENVLRELQYKNLIFKCSKSISDENAFKAIDLLLQHNFNNNKFSVCKYFEINNNYPVIFDKYSPYSHPNLFLGYFNNLSFNLQFSHHQINNNFSYFTRNDLIFKNKIQCVCNEIYIYDNFYKQQFLNYNSLDKNTLTPYENLNPIEVQRYIENNEIGLKNIITKSLKI